MPVSRVAIPFGSYDRHVLRHLRNAGITRAFTSDGGRARPHSWLQPRTSLRADIDREWVQSVLDGRPSLARRARRAAARGFKRVRWMIGAPKLSRIAVVIVTYNSADVLSGCLAALPEGAKDVELTDVIVVDNASTDESVRIAKEAWPPVEIVQLDENAGYAAGFNAGVDALAGREPDAVLVLNPDCRLRPGTLAVMADALSVAPRGIVAPRLLNLDGTLQPTLRRAPTVGGALAEALIGGPLAGRIGLGELIFDENSHNRAGPSAWATGAALLISWEALVQVGPWNETFLLYSEETEFLFRAADHGWILWYEPMAVVEHKGGEAGTNPRLAALLVVNKVKFYRQQAWQRRVDGLLACCAAWRITAGLGRTEDCSGISGRPPSAFPSDHLAGGAGVNDVRNVFSTCSPGGACTGHALRADGHLTILTMLRRLQYE